MFSKIVLFYSRDSAGRNIARILEKISDVNIVRVEKEILYHKTLQINPEVCIVASRHKSDSGIQVLTTHSPGNFGTAEFGGNLRELSIAPATYLRKALICLEEEKEKRDLEYETSFEATHHGPTSLRFPIMFVEVGSSEKQWSDLDACSAVAEAIKRLVESEPEDTPSAIGLGGGHYCRKFSKIRKYAIGHICPKHNLGRLDKVMIEQMIAKTMPKPEVALIEKKGMGTEKHRIIGLLEETGLDVVKI